MIANMYIQQKLPRLLVRKAKRPRSIYRWSISHILEHESFCLGRLGCLGSQGSKEKKVDLSFSEQLLRVFFFQLFVGKKKIKISALKSCIKYIFFFKFLKK